MSETSAINPRCRKCGGDVGNSYLFSADGSTYHHGCFPGQEKPMTRPERIELLAKALCRAKHGNEDMWANYKAMAERLLSDEFEAVLRKVLQ